MTTLQAAAAPRTDGIKTMPHRLLHTPLSLVGGAGGVAMAASGAVAQTAEVAAGSTATGGASVAWLGAGVAIFSFGLQCYQQIREKRRVLDDADAAAQRVRDEAAAQAHLLQESREYEQWGPKVDREMKLRNRAEARLEIVEAENGQLKIDLAEVRRENREMVGKMLQMEAKVASLTASLDDYKAKQDRVVEVVKKTRAKTDKNAERIEAVELSTGSTSGVFPATPVPPEPKP